MIFDSLVKPALDSVTTLIEQFHMSPEDKAKAQAAIAQAAADAQQRAIDYDTKLNDIAGQNIRAETSSADKFTARARPSFMYVIIAVLAFNYIGLPIAQIFGSKIGPITLPSDLLTLFGVCVTGYVVSRTAEKGITDVSQAAAKVAAMPGDSQISILGMKMGNKS